MTISVTLLGLTLGAVFFAYFTFSETKNANVIDATTMEFATIVSMDISREKMISIFVVVIFCPLVGALFLFCMNRFLGMVNEHQMASTQMIRIGTSTGWVVLEL